MSESKMAELFSFILTLAGAILFFTGDSDKSRTLGIVLAVIGILAICIITPIFKAKEIAAKQKEEHKEDQKRCPKCGKKMESDWEICPYCQTDLNTYSEDNQK